MIRKNLWDKWFGTMTLKFWSIGSGKALEFAHVHCSELDLPALMRQVGIPHVSQEFFQVEARFGLLTWLRAQIGAAIAIAVVSAGVVAAAPLETGTPNFSKSSLAWYSWMFIARSPRIVRRAAV